MRTTHDPLAVRNERIKLFSGFVNAVGIGLLGFAVLRPVTEDLANAAHATLWWWGLAGLAMHALSHYILGYLHKETAS